MTEMVIAAFDAAAAADAATQDLETARIPSAIIRRELDDDPERHEGYTSGRSVVKVTVDEIHADAVTGILNQHGPLQIEEHAAGRRR